jgi:predicted nuclease of restriction endonuclease-like (RecB) superfamily
MKKFYLTFPILQTVSAQFNHLSRSHFVFLIGIAEEDKRMFYAIESQANHRSLRELKRQFDTSLYHRLALSKDAEQVRQLTAK